MSGCPHILFNIVQFMLGIHSPYLRKVLEVVFFGLQIEITSNKHLVNCMSELCWWNWRHYIFHTMSSARTVTLHLIFLTCSASKSHAGSGVVSEEAAVPCLLFCHQRHAVNSIQDCVVEWCVALLKKQVINFLVIGQVFKKLFWDVCNILMWIYDLGWWGDWACHEHTNIPTLTSFNGTSRVHVWVFAYQYLLLCELYVCWYEVKVHHETEGAHTPFTACRNCIQHMYHTETHTVPVEHLLQVTIPTDLKSLLW